MTDLATHVIAVTGDARLGRAIAGAPRGTMRTERRARRYVRGAAIAVLSAGLLGFASQVEPADSYGTAVVSIPDEDSLTYGDGVWRVDGRAIDVECPSEDSCTATVADGAVTVRQVTS